MVGPRTSEPKYLVEPTLWSRRRGRDCRFCRASSHLLHIHGCIADAQSSPSPHGRLNSFKVGINMFHVLRRFHRAIRFLGSVRSIVLMQLRLRKCQSFGILLSRQRASDCAYAAKAAQAPEFWVLELKWCGLCSFRTSVRPAGCGAGVFACGGAPGVRA